MKQETLNLLDRSIENILKTYPFVEVFLDTHGLMELSGDDKSITLGKLFDRAYSIGNDLWSSRTDFEHVLNCYIKDAGNFYNGYYETIQSITIEPGVDKDGTKESIEAVTLHKGHVIGLTGPTGSGKSRLLADIEWLAQADTPTQRRILINGKQPSREQRFSPHFHMVTMLSQNMNFVMDLDVEEFLLLHAQSICVGSPEKVIKQILTKANELAGEPFNYDTSLTSLSGGQSRALMIADAAFLSQSPVVLIDEIENAGIDRRQALDILVGQDKIVLMATHDPILALCSDYRLVLKNGAISKVIQTSYQERELLARFEPFDKELMKLREKLRLGQSLIYD